MSLTWTLDLCGTRPKLPMKRLILALPYYGMSWPTTTRSSLGPRQPVPPTAAGIPDPGQQDHGRQGPGTAMTRSRRRPGW